MNPTIYVQTVSRRHRRYLEVSGSAGARALATWTELGSTRVGYGTTTTDDDSARTIIREHLAAGYRRATTTTR